MSPRRNPSRGRRTQIRAQQRAELAARDRSGKRQLQVPEAIRRLAPEQPAPEAGHPRPCPIYPECTTDHLRRNP